MSVPNQNCCEGCFKRLTGATACGSTVPSQGASAAIRIIAASTIPPTMAVGWRLNASLKRPMAGDCAGKMAISAPAMSVADARIEEHVAQVHREVDQHVSSREDENDALNDRIIAPQDGIHCEAAYAGDREHGLGNDRAAHEERDPDADDSHDRNRGILESVSSEDCPWRQSLGLRGTDIVLCEHVEHAGARNARDQRDVNRAERYARQDEVAQPVPEVLADAAVALHRQPLELDRKDEDEQVREHEDG